MTIGEWQKRFLKARLFKESMLDLLTVITLCLLASFVLGEISRRLGFPSVIGQIMAGLLFGIPIIKEYFTEEALHSISFLGDIGIVFLLLLAGLEINAKKFKKAERDSLWISLFGVVIPFFFGFFAMRLMSFDVITAFVVGAGMSLTSEGTTVKLLMDLKVLNTKLSTILLSAGIIDDIFEILFLSVILLNAHRDVTGLALFPFKLLLFAGIVFLAYRFFPKMHKMISKERNKVNTFSSTLLFALIIAVASNFLGLGPIIGALLAGVIINLRENDMKEHKEIVEELRTMTFSFIVPFFFINIGIQFDWTEVFSNWPLIIVILSLGLTTKIVAALMATPLTDLSLAQTYLIGWGMNSRGAIELVIANIALSYALIPNEVYNAIVLMALVTTLLFPFVLRAHIKHGGKKIMD
jgi:Kef-type K+ transport system membrane component KefB